MIDVQNAVILYAGFIADPNIVYVSADSHVQPHARPLTYYHIANHLSACIDIGRTGNARRYSAIGSNHDGSSLESPAANRNSNRQDIRTGLRLCSGYQVPPADRLPALLRAVCRSENRRTDLLIETQKIVAYSVGDDPELLSRLCKL